MSTVAAAPLVPNGNSAVPADVLREAQFLQQLLKIRDDVFASKHPRIHLPTKIIDQVAPRPPQTAPTARATLNGVRNGVSSSQSFPPRSETSLQSSSSTNEFVAPVPASQRPFSAKSISSGIDPVLLTKSDHLIRAELQLRRQQIERQIKDQFDRKGRGSDNEEREAHLNVEECLNQAHLRVPPVSGLQSTSHQSDAGESFDENSYYSSKADSWSSEEVDSNNAINADLTGSLTLQSKQPVTGNNQPRAVEPTVIDLDDEAYEPADDIEIYDPAAMPDETEEEDYSPPPADIGAHEPSRGRPRDRGNQNRNGNHGYGSFSSFLFSSFSSFGFVQLFPNPVFSLSRNMLTILRPSRRQSPTGPAPPLQNPRKRRRDEKREGKKQRQQQPLPRPMSSPEPYIKEEPQSPPAFVAESQPSKRRALQPLPADKDAVRTQDAPRTQPIYYREPETSARRYQEIDEPLSPAIVPAAQRRTHRDDHDLRRVASFQYARRPYSPDAGGEVYAAEPRQFRSASHAFVDRPETSIYREASARPAGAPRYVRERSRSPVHEYISRPQSPMVMAPPPRRIVVDQYGNKYYAAPVEIRESAAPPSTRRLEVDPYHERAATREPTMRAARTEFYDDDMAQRMPPPPRRYLESTGHQIIEAPTYRREVSRRPVEPEYRPQFEEMGPLREYLPSRSYSMRPEVVRREVPEGYIRHESIQPGSSGVPQPRMREVSVVRPDTSDERRYYSVAPQSRRYVEDEPIEVAQEPYTQRVYTRY